MSKDPFGVCLNDNCDDEAPQPTPAMPSAYQMAKGLFNSAKDIVAGAIQGEGVFVDEPVYDARMDICKGCPFLTEDTRCTKCGCYMKTKAAFKKTRCPIGNWEAEND